MRGTNIGRGGEQEVSRKAPTVLATLPEVEGRWKGLANVMTPSVFQVKHPDLMRHNQDESCGECGCCLLAALPLVARVQVVACHFPTRCIAFLTLLFPSPLTIEVGSMARC